MLNYSPGSHEFLFDTSLHAATFGPCCRFGRYNVIQLNADAVFNGLLRRLYILKLVEVTSVIAKRVFCLFRNTLLVAL